MKTILVLVLLGLAALCLGNAIYYDTSDESVRSYFEEFKAKYGRHFETSSQESDRLTTFKTNLMRINFLNSIHDGATYGINAFADLSPEEFASKYLRPMDVSERTSEMEPVSVKDVPSEWDWSKNGAVTPVKNQGSCGSCWAFSTTGNIEGAWFLAGHPLTSFSEQQLVDCDREKDEGCNGGLMENAMNYIIEFGGLETEKDYPYVGAQRTCSFDRSKAVGKISKWEFVSKDEGVIRDTLYAKGPLSVALNAEWLQFYIGGISDPIMCSATSLNHGVTLVGYGSGKHFFSTVDYWLVKNSWGSGWGEHGYFRIIRGKGKCGINTYVISATI